jgi:hypothetical protein
MFRIFLLSPARLDGRRAEILSSPKASFDLAVRLKNGGAPIGEVFSFLSGLYFRGKLAYAQHFARPCEGTCGILVITSNRGMVTPDTIVNLEDLQSLNRVDIDFAEKRFTRPLLESAMNLARSLPDESDVILLGSIGTKKYAEPLTEIFQDRLHFPSDFIGRGDMSRGGLLLRCVESNNELNYIPVMGAVRHGKRPPKLEPKRR